MSEPTEREYLEGLRYEDKFGSAPESRVSEAETVRLYLERCSDETGYITPKSVLDAVTALEAVATAAQSFVGTTSYYRQTKASRDEFEKLAVALIALSTESASKRTTPESPSSAPETQP